MVKAIIFDCFGVLYQGSLDYLYSVTPDKHHKELRDLTRASDYGYIEQAEFMSHLTQLTGLPEAHLKDVINAHHVRNDSLVELVKELKPKYKIGLLSNVGRGVMEQLFSSEEQRELFDAVVLSSDIGSIKPSRSAYLAASSALQVEPEQCLMVDDMPSNIEGAEAAGMNGVVFYSTKQFVNEFKSLEAQNA